MAFRYSKKAYKALWFFLIMTWMTVVLETANDPLGHNPPTLFLIVFGSVAVLTLVFLAFLDIIEWRYPRR